MKNLSNENIIHVKDGNIEYLQFRRLLEYKDKIVHAYTLGVERNYRPKADGLERKKEVKENYTNLCDTIGANYNNLVYTNQFHTDTVEVVKEVKNFIEEEINVDGLCTNVAGIILSTVNADCILFMFYDPVKNVIANIHSGWKGTLQRISVKTIEKMKQEYGCNPKDIICCISPSIRKCHFEVEKDVKDLYEKEFTDIDLTNIIEEKILNQKWNIDTVLVNKIILEQAGLQENNIIDSNICSVCNKELVHSYRVQREGYGVETAVIGLKK